MKDVNQFDEKGNLVIKEEDKLPKEFKEKLLNSLRSGLYKKCEGTLHEPKEDGHYSDNFIGEFCVMGVAAHIAGAPEEKLLDMGSISNKDMTRLKIKTEFPKVLSANYKEGAIQEHLINMNDGGDSFKKIANWIEKKL